MARKTATKKASAKSSKLKKQVKPPTKAAVTTPTVPFTQEQVPTKARKLPPAYQLFIQACKVPARHWEIFGGILLIYAILNIGVIGGLTGGSDLGALKDVVSGALTGQFAQIGTGFALYGFLVSSSATNAASGIASAYSSMLLLITSLAIIWALRQVYAGNKIRIRDTFYNGMQPLVQFMIMLFLVGLQLIPAVLGGFLSTSLVGTNILVETYQVAIVWALFFVLAAWSIYMLCASLFAFYIVTLPGMTPLKALRSAKTIVQARRGQVLLKLLFLPIALLCSAAVFMVPLALFATAVAPYIFFVCTIFVIVIVHSYMYALYRELIVE